MKEYQQNSNENELEITLENDLRKKITAGVKPKIAVIYPKSGIVLEDLWGALGSSKHMYSIQPFPCPMNNPSAIRDKLEKLDRLGFDAIALIRGGGEHLNVLDSQTVIKACAALNTPFMIAAGHFVDNPLIQHIASKICGTPSMLGVYLSQLPSKVNYGPKTNETPIKPEKTNIFKKIHQFISKRAKILKITAHILFFYALMNCKSGDGIIAILFFWFWFAWNTIEVKYDDIYYEETKKMQQDKNHIDFHHKHQDALLRSIAGFIPKKAEDTIYYNMYNDD